MNRRVDAFNKTWKKSKVSEARKPIEEDIVTTIVDDIYRHGKYDTHLRKVNSEKKPGKESETIDVCAELIKKETKKREDIVARFDKAAQVKAATQKAQKSQDVKEKKRQRRNQKQVVEKPVKKPRHHQKKPQSRRIEEE